MPSNAAAESPNATAEPSNTTTKSSNTIINAVEYLNDTESESCCSGEKNEMHASHIKKNKKTHVPLEYCTQKKKKKHCSTIWIIEVTFFEGRF